MAEVQHPRGSRSLSSHLKSRLKIDGIKAGILHELLPKTAFNDPVALASALKALPITLGATRPLDEAISTAGGVRFDDVRLSFWVGNVALAVILLDGGLRTSFATFRTGLRPALLLATVGVVLCAGLTAVAGRLIVGLDWPAALLLGAIVGSTDAAAVFSLLQRSGVTLN